jgi:hypothetical protein
MTPLTSPVWLLSRAVCRYPVCSARMSPAESEFHNWLHKLPVVPHLSVIELSAAAAPAPTVLLQEAEGMDAEAQAESESEAEAETESDATPSKSLVPAKVIDQFVDIEREPLTNLNNLLAALPPMPQIVADADAAPVEVDV